MENKTPKNNNKELIVRSTPDVIDFALLINGELIELHKEEKEQSHIVGDIILAKIRKPATGLNAAFVNVGHKKDGFLHYSDLGKHIRTHLKFVKNVTSKKSNDFNLAHLQYEESIEKEGKIEEIVAANQSVLVQIIKEPISTKGPRLSAEISVAGRYLVVTPFSDKVSTSQKIPQKDERDRLEKLIKSIKPRNFGVIIRTAAEGKQVNELSEDLKYILHRWKEMCLRLQNSPIPSKVLSEVSKASSIIRDLFNDDFTGIYVEDEPLFEEIKEAVGKIAPNKETIVKFYKSAVPIFEKYGIERQIKSSFGRVVYLSKGAYLVIEHTEALHVIDVNSGGRSNKGSTQQDTAMEVNLMACKEVAKQLKLRDMGGIIVVDFIDIDSPEDRKKLHSFLKEQMASDKAKHKVLPPSKFGLVQITRQRVRPEKNIETQEEDPNKEGNNIPAPILIIDRIEEELQQLIEGKSHKKIILNLHPFIAAYLTKGLISIQMKWFFKYKSWIKIIPRDAYKYLEYNFTDAEGSSIKLEDL